MRANADVRVQADLFAVLIKASGERIDLGDLRKRKTWLRRLMDLSLFDQRGLVTVAGVKYMASDFASGGVTPTISGFKFHDSGIGITAAANTDTAIQTPPSPQPARVSGAGTTPGATNIYQTVATIAYTGTNAITEWGLFSALTSGTLWDRRVFSAINVASGDSVQFTYSLTIPSN